MQNTNDLKEKLQNDLKQALLGKDSTAKTVIRQIMATVKNKEIEIKDTLDDTGILAVISTLVKQHKDSIEQFRKGGRDDLVHKELRELDVLQQYMPQQLSEDELEKIVVDSITELQLTSKKEMGQAMKVIMPKVKGRADGNQVKMLVQKHVS